MIVPVLLITTTIGAVFDGYVLTWLWLWFAVPFGLPVISIPWAIGISVLISTFTHKMTALPKKVEDADATEQTVMQLVDALIFDAMALGIGWIVHLFM